MMPARQLTGPLWRAHSVELIDPLDSRALNDGRSLLPGCKFLSLLAIAIDPSKLFLISVIDDHSPIGLFSFSGFSRSSFRHQCSKTTKKAREEKAGSNAGSAFPSWPRLSTRVVD
jgi:hypothetical protein